MPCYKPLGAVQTKGGSISFHPSAQGEQIAIPCNKCIGCKLENSRQWALRCTHEQRQHQRNSWLTLTYDDEHLPYGASLVPEHLTLFFKRLRRQNDGKEIRYFACGEYGDEGGRPHYHICLFGHDFDDRVYWRDSHSGEPIDSSDQLNERWGMGLCAVGDLTYESAAYTARYCLKKITGDMAHEHYTRILPDGTMYEVEPEFCVMSKRPGIGARHFEDFNGEIYRADACIINGIECKPPRYYDKLLEKQDPRLYEQIKTDRRNTAASRKEENTLNRRRQKEAVKQDQLNQLKRSLED